MTLDLTEIPRKGPKQWTYTLDKEELPSTQHNGTTSDFGTENGSRVIQLCCEPLLWVFKYKMQYNLNKPFRLKTLVKHLSWLHWLASIWTKVVGTLYIVRTADYRLPTYPNTKSIESITLLLPLPLGPMIAVKYLWKGPSSCLPA